MKKKYEIEVRGPLTENEYTNLAKKLKRDGQYIETKKRILIDYSTFLPGEEMENRSKDIRLRVTNGQPEIVVKLGSWGGHEQREEIVIPTSKGSFDDLVKVFSILGYSKGMLCVRTSKVYNYQGVEFALVEIPGHSHTFEAEKMVSSSDAKDKASQEIQHVCHSLDLKTYTDEEFFDYVKLLNTEANEIFEYTNQQDDYFLRRYNL